ncbi:hypothetical protein MBRA1_001109 [Malassezia brasiliensis]|uniref:Bromo domain-containing protein n=1 Tax=Malassezia brasiliensis TaxID=1821822 RepID=A0AAF0DV51_9BASI|nr:hypothetical protein MBRA1_001109 [Malassezia brasiliensis]
MSTGRPTLNSKVFFTALPDRFEDLLAKARELFPVPADCTPQLFVACPSTVGTASSEQRGAILLADAMPFLRDRELLTLRWTATDSPAREANARVQWDPKLPALESTRAANMAPVWRGPQARAAHVARVLERERNYAEEWTDNLRKPIVARTEPSVFGKPLPAQKREPLSPPPSSPTASPEHPAEISTVEAPASPTPQRTQDVSPAPLVWKSPEGTTTSPHTDLEPIQDTPGLSRLGALCARLNPFGRGTLQKDTSMSQNTAQTSTPPPSKVPDSVPKAETAKEARPAPKLRAKPLVIPDMAHMEGAMAYEVITQVLAAVREHPCAMQFRSPMSYELRRFCERRGRVLDLNTIGARVAKRDFGHTPLVRFAEELATYLDNVVAFYGEHSYQTHAAMSLGKFAETLLKELSRQKPSEKRSVPRTDGASDDLPGGKGEMSSPAPAAATEDKQAVPGKEAAPTKEAAERTAPATPAAPTKREAPAKHEAPAPTSVRAGTKPSTADVFDDLAPAKPVGRKGARSKPVAKPAAKPTASDASSTAPAPAPAPAPDALAEGNAAKNSGATSPSSETTDLLPAAGKRRATGATQPVAKRTRRSSRVKT